MDPDLVITVLFVCEVVLAALVFAFFVLHEAHKGHAATASAVTGSRSTRLPG